MATSLETTDQPSWVEDFDFEQAPILEPPRGRRWRRWLAAIVIIGLLAAGTLWFINPFGTKVAATLVTGTAATGTIVSSVSLSGSVASLAVHELSFGTSGTVTAVNVQPGDTVAAGQILATIDDSALMVQLATAEANLTSAKARLDLDNAGPTAAQLASYKDAVAQAKLQLSTAKQSLTDTTAQNNLNVAQAKSQLAAAKAKQSSDVATLPPGDPQFAADQTAVENATANLSTVQLKATLSLHQAQNQVSSATLGVTSAEHSYTLKIVPSTAAQIAADKAAVAQSQQALTTLQQSGSTIVAPIAGTVTVVGIKVGDAVSGSSNAASSGGTSSSTGQIEVMDLAHLQVSGQASETDIPKLKMGQAATISATALGSETAVGKICALSVVGTQISGVTSFGVTVCLDAAQPSLLIGMSATAAVVTDRADNAVMVPSLAVKTVGGQRVVTVLGADGKTQTNVTVTVGISNGSETQILTGLQGNETVVESIQTTSPTQGGFGGGPGLGGGGFGGG